MPEKWPNLLFGPDTAPPPPSQGGETGDPRVLYRLALAARGTSGLGAEIISDVFDTVGTPARALPLSWTEVLNGEGTCEVWLPIDHASVTRANFAVGNRELHVYRDDGNGEVLVWAGRLWAVDVQDWFVRMLGKGFYHDLSRREIVSDYTSRISAGVFKDQLTIVRDLINATQALTDGGLGFTHNDLSVSGVTRKLIVCAEERRQISDVIEELASADDGFDFAVLPDKRVRLWYPRRGQVNTGLTFSASDNVSEFRYQEDAEEMANDVAVVGPQENCEVPDVTSAVDTTSRSTYGVLHASESAEFVDDETLRQGQADEMLRERKDSRLQPDVQVPTQLSDAVDFYDYQLGDTVTVVATRGEVGGFGQFNQAFRIVGRRVDVTNYGLENVTLSLDRNLLT